MPLNNIKKQLDQLGYHTFITSEGLIVGIRDGVIPEIPNGIKVKSFCNVKLEPNNTITVSFGKSALPEWEEFTSESAVVKFIKEKFKL